MDQLLQDKIIEYIQGLWKKHNSSYELEGIWLALHEPMNRQDNEFSIPVIKTWFIKNNSVEEKKPIDYKVFMNFGIRSERTYTIAYSNTALIKDSDLIYIGYQLDRLYGRGMLFKVNSEGDLECVQDLWIS